MTTETETKIKTAKCANCDWAGDPEEAAIGEIPHFWERVEVGDIMPACECPECGAIAFIDDERQRLRDAAPALARMVELMEELSGAAVAMLNESCGLDAPSGVTTPLECARDAARALLAKIAGRVLDEEGAAP